MPTDNSKQPQQLLPLPTGIKTVDQLVTVMNDRIDQTNLAMQRFVQNPALGPVDLGQQKIINLADPKDDLDAVNLRTLKKFGAVAVVTGTGGQGSGIDKPTIYFTFDGAPFDGEESPFAPIGANRDGFTPVSIFASAVGVPTSAPCQINITIAGASMLATNLSIPVGSQGPVFSTGFALAAALRKGMLLQGLIAVAGGATQVTIALELRGN